jgi:hypothetical protein
MDLMCLSLLDRRRNIGRWRVRAGRRRTGHRAVGGFDWGVVGCRCCAVIAMEDVALP